MPKHILITGANGQVGQELQVLIENNEHNLQDANFYMTDKDTLDITCKNELEKFLVTNTIDTVINCAAYTAVDKAEEEQKTADGINHLAVKYIAELAKLHSIQFIHISTDYVFDGTNHTPYIEDHPTNPQSVYGQTKLDGEMAMCTINPSNSMIIRTSWVYSSYGNNFVKTMLKLGQERDELGIIFDQVGTPTYAKDLARTILQIIQKGIKNKSDSMEIYHYSNEGVSSWYDFAKAIFEISSIECRIQPIVTAEYPTPARRPHYSILNKEKIKNDFALEIPYWKDSLIKCIPLMMKKKF